MLSNGQAAFVYNSAMKNNETHTTLYRAYRPQDFDAVRGQEHIVKALEASIKNKKIAHAYLFSGGRGTGKTSVARILARKLGVTDKDLYEMDAASNRGIDDIRELREGVYAMPFESPYKFYIIDEAHMLTKEAWNALLKTLEEPPAHVIFVLATTDRDKVPDTIQSRCEVYSFKQPTREILADIVTDVAKKEDYMLEPAAAELVALLAEGSFRDSLSILQKVLTVAKGKKVSIQDVELVSGAPRSELVREIITGIAKKDANAALAAVHKAIESNIDARTLTRILIHRLRVILLMRYAPDIAKDLSKELSEADLLLAQQITKEPGVHSDTLRVLLEAHATMQYAAIPYVPLELALIDICQTVQK